LADNTLNFIFDGDNSGFQQALKGVQDQLKQVGNQMKDFGGTMSTYVSLPLAALGGAAIKAFGDFQSLKNGLTAITGSAEEAEKQFLRLKEIAKLPSLGLQEVTKGSMNLQVIGFTAEKAEKSIMAFGNAVATVGGSTDQFERAVYGLSQLANTDFPLGEDLNIIKDAIPQVTPLLKEAFGTARSDELKELGITSGQVADAIVNGLSKLPKAAGGVKAAFENLKDGVFSNLAELGEIINNNLDIAEFSDKIVDGLSEVTKWFKSLSPQTQKITLAFAAFAIVLPPIIAALGVFIGTVLPALMVGFAALASPVTLVVAAIAAAAYAIISNWDAVKAYFVSGEGSAFFDAIISYASDWWDSLKSIFNTVKGYIISIWNTIGSNVIGAVKGSFIIIQGVIATVLGVISGWFKVFSSVLKGDWSGAWEGLKTVAISIWNGILSIVKGGLTMLNNTLASFFKMIGANNIAAGFENANKRIAKAFDFLSVPVKKATTAVKDFNKEVAKSDAPTITKKTDDKKTLSADEKKRAEDIADVYKDLAIKLQQIGVEFGKSFDEKAVSRIGAYQDAINGLIKNGVDPLSSSIKKLQALQQDNNLLQLPKGFSNKVSDSKGKTSEAKIALPKIQSVGVDKDFQKILGLAKNFNTQFTGLITDGIAGGLGDAFSSIGEAFATGGNVIAAFGQSLIGAFGKFLSQFGDMLLQYGVAALVKSKLDAALLVPGAGLFAAPAAIAAGLALKVAAGAFAGLLGGGKQQKQTAFAKGGIVSSPTNAIFGEYPSAGRGNPEVVAPLNSLKSMLGDVGGSSGGQVYFEIQGDKLVGVLNNHSKRQLRTS